MARWFMRSSPLICCAPGFLAAALLSAAVARADDSARPSDVIAPSGDTKMPAEPTFVVAKWRARLYGFAEADSFLDSSQSLVDLQGNQLLSAPGTTAGQAGRFQESARNSRLGFAVESPEFRGMKASGTLESDFLGFEPNPGVIAGATEATLFNGAFRIRHAWAKLQTPFVDILAGQSWTLFGWNPIFTPASVSLQGLPNEIFERIPQLRLSHVFDFGFIKLEAAASAQRPFQRDSSMPDFIEAVRLEVPGWQGEKGTASVVNAVVPLQLAFSATQKQFRVLRPAPVSPTDFETATGSAFAVDAIIPLIRATKTDKSNALTFVVEASAGTGDFDVFTGLSGGASIGTPKGVPAGTTFMLTPGLDAGPAGFASDTGLLETIDWRTLLMNLQYYTPIDNGAVWMHFLYNVGTSDNINLFARRGAAFFNQKYAALGFFYDPTPAFRIGLEGQWTRQQMTDNAVRVNRRAQLSFFYLFI